LKTQHLCWSGAASYPRYPPDDWFVGQVKFLASAASMAEPSIIRRANAIGIAALYVSCDAVFPVEAGQVVAYRRIG
jgi:hypothetical protein